MVVTDVCLLMGDNGRMGPFPVFSRQHDVAHPTERIYVAVRYDDPAPVLLTYYLSLPDYTHYGKDRYDYAYKDENHSGEE